jgi:hypothetical protein
MEANTLQSKKMLVRRILGAKAELGNRALYEEYEALFSVMNKLQFTRFITVTFSKPMTDDIEVVEVCRLIKRRLNKFFYRRQKSKIKFAFVIEADKLLHKSLTKYHVHILMTEPIDILRKATALKRKLLYQNCFALNYIIEKQLRKLRTISLNSRSRLKRIDIESIYSQECLCDYLLKQLKPSSRSYLNIDFINSDLSWSDE